jgi:hypothetical protein
LLFVYFVWSRKTLRYAIIAGIFAALAYLTKQSALIACLPVLVFLFWRNWRRGLACFFTAGLIIGITTLVFNQTSSGWYVYYVFGLLSQQTEWIYQEFVTFWNDDLLVHVPVAILISVVFFAGRVKHDKHAFFQWLAITTGAMAAAFFTRVKIGGYDNVLLPAYAAISILFGLGLNELLKLSRNLQVEIRNGAQGLILLACLFQLLMLAYNPFAQIPTNADLEAGKKFIQLLSNVKGEVFLPDHGYLPTLAGKQTYAHNSAIWDVLRGSQLTLGKTLLTQDLEQAIRSQVFDEIILDSDLDLDWCCVGIDQTYTRVGEVFPDQTSFYTITGDRKRPTYIYLADRLK